jgi:hypothetical protein
VVVVEISVDLGGSSLEIHGLLAAHNWKSGAWQAGHNRLEHQSSFNARFTRASAVLSPPRPGSQPHMASTPVRRLRLRSGHPSCVAQTSSTHWLRRTSDACPASTSSSQAGSNPARSATASTERRNASRRSLKGPPSRRGMSACQARCHSLSRPQSRSWARSAPRRRPRGSSSENPPISFPVVGSIGAGPTPAHKSWSSSQAGSKETKTGSTP